jgi:predicted DNA-binding transcriptional regulator AlpA
MTPRYLSPDQVAAMLPGISRGQLAQLRFRGDGPPYRKPTPRTVLYVEAEVIAWVEAALAHGSSG